MSWACYHNDPDNVFPILQKVLVSNDFKLLFFMMLYTFLCVIKKVIIYLNNAVKVSCQNIRKLVMSQLCKTTHRADAINTTSHCLLRPVRGDQWEQGLGFFEGVAL